MKLRYYAEAEVGVDHRRTLELLEAIAEQYAVPVEVVQVDSAGGPPDEFPGHVEQRSLEDAWDDFTDNPTLQDGLGTAPSSAYRDPDAIVGNVGIVVDGDLVWATQFWGTHHGWGNVDPEETAIGFLEAVDADGIGVIADRVPMDDWEPGSAAAEADDDPDGDATAPVPDGVQRPTRDAIRKLCTAQSFQRGVTYHEDGRVRNVSVDDGDVAATIHGSHDYRTSVDLSVDGFAPHCTCPYDYAGECKHVVALLLTVAERFDDLYGSDTASDAGSGNDQHESPTADTTPVAGATAATGDVADAIADADAATLRAFLRDVLADDADLRERFLAAVETPVTKRVADYKRDIDQAFADATGRRGIVEYDTHIDFQRYDDLAETYREHDAPQQALRVYRAIAEAIRENLSRIDDSSGYYGQQLERAVDAYAECVREMALEPADKREYIDYLVDQYTAAEFGFVVEDYDAALRTVCTTDADLEYLLSLLRPHVPTDETPSVASTTEIEADSQRNDDTETDSHQTDDVPLPDPTRGRLDADLFTGGAVDLDHLGVGPLAVTDFVGETVAAKLEEAALSTESTVSSGRRRLSGRERTILSTYLWVLGELDDRETLQAVLDDVYTETATFYRQYVEALLADGQDDRARDVVEDGLDRFSNHESVYRFAADFYKGRDDERYRDLLQTLFVRFDDWDAYDELEAACSDDQWASVSHGIRTQLGHHAPDRLIDLYLHESEREKACSKVVERRDLDEFRRYRADVADVDPDTYFETYRDHLEPYLADDTGRDHYRTVIKHLHELAQVGSDDAFEAFVDRLREKHSNRPAFLDELDQAGL